MRHLIIIPTYNELDNIRNLVPELLKSYPQCELLIVDDGSPDGTAQEVLAQKKSLRDGQRVHILERRKKEGLARAYLAGFNWGLQQGYDTLIEMDADFSHRPSDLSKVISGLQSHDFVIGSRWVTGGGTENWSLIRKIISFAGSMYSRLILRFPIRDWTGGFNGWRRKVLQTIGLENIHSQGYSFQIELKYKASKLGFKGCEVPIIFAERKAGQSKMSFRIFAEALVRVFAIRWGKG